MAAAAILRNREIAISLQQFRQFWQGNASAPAPSHLVSHQNVRIFEIQEGASRHLEKIEKKIRYICVID